MASLFPGANDTFTVPSAPSTTSLSQAGDSNDRNHVQHHKALGEAVVAIQENVALDTHDHSGQPDSAGRKTPKLKAANTHEDVDTTSASAIHHKLGTGASDAAPGNHTHDYNSGSITGQPYIICMSTSRPSSPVPGMRIYEADTNQVRVWAKIPPQTTESWRLCTDGVVPYVKLRQTRSQSIPTSGTLVEWHAEIEDARGNFNPSNSLTNFVAPDIGLYRVEGVIGYPKLGVADAYGVGLRVNGVMRSGDPQDKWVSIKSMAGHIQNIDFSGEVRISNIGDRISVWVGHNAWLAQNTSSDNAQGCRVTIKYVGL